MTDIIYYNDLAKKLVQRAKNGKDSVVAICGDEGDGKSTLAANIGIASDDFFDFERNELFSPTVEEMREKVVGLPRYSTIIADEAIKILYKLNWQSKSQRFLNELYALCRRENKTTLLCIPRLTDLNEQFRNHRVRFWLQVIDSVSGTKKDGHAVLFKRSWVPGRSDPWNLGELEKMINKFCFNRKIKEVEMNFEDKIRVLSRHRNFVAVVGFSWMPPVWWERYSALKNSIAYVDEKEVDSRRDIALKYRIKKLIDALVAKGESFEAIGGLVGLSKARVYAIHKAKE